MYLSQLKTSLAAGPLKPVYAIYGNNQFEFREALALLRKRVAQDGDSDLSIVELPRDQRDLAVVMDALQTAPMFVSTRMVIIQSADQFVNQHRKTLEKYLENPSPTGVLVLTLEKWNRTTRLAKAVEKLGGDISCWLPRSSDQLMTWTTSRARSAYGKKLDIRAAEMLMNLCQDEPASIDGELTKLAIFVGDAPQITEADVLAGAMSYGADNPFDLADKIMQGDHLGALRVADGLISEGMPAVALVGILRSSFRRLLYLVLLAQRDGRAAAMKTVTYPKEREAMAPRLSQYTSGGVIRGYRALLEADVAAKSTGSDTRRIVEKLIMNLLPQKLAAGAGQ